MKAVDVPVSMSPFSDVDHRKTSGWTFPPDHAVGTGASEPIGWTDVGAGFHHPLVLARCHLNQRLPVMMEEVDE